MSKTRALFELTEERGRVHPRGVDPEEHQLALHELSATRSRLKDEVVATTGRSAYHFMLLCHTLHAST